MLHELFYIQAPLPLETNKNQLCAIYLVVSKETFENDLKQAGAELCQAQLNLSWLSTI